MTTCVCRFTQVRSREVKGTRKEGVWVARRGGRVREREGVGVSCGETLTAQVTSCYSLARGSGVPRGEVSGCLPSARRPVMHAGTLSVNSVFRIDTTVLHAITETPRTTGTRDFPD